MNKKKTRKSKAAKSIKDLPEKTVSAKDANFETDDRAATLVLRPSVQPAMKRDTTSELATSELTEMLPPVRHRKR